MAPHDKRGAGRARRRGTYERADCRTGQIVFCTRTNDASVRFRTLMMAIEPGPATFEVNLPTE
jgi:hypothetical protein